MGIVLNRLSRLAPLTGVVFAVVAVVAFGTASGAPKETATGAQIIAFFEAHGSHQQASDYLPMLALAFFLLFAGSLRGCGGISGVVPQPSTRASFAVAVVTHDLPCRLR
jgi:hypothetical protein